MCVVSDALRWAWLIEAWVILGENVDIGVGA